jgi:hypothetical protein
MRLKDIILIVIAFGICVGVFMYPAFPQDIAYHMFADQRSFLDVPNFLDVFSNLGFIVVGVYGLRYLYRNRITPFSFEYPIERVPYIIFFLGSVLVGVGSIYYHLAPDNETLYWDRIPLIAVAMSLFSALIMERIGVALGLYLGPVLLALGVVSVSYWEYTEIIGAGDVRFYALAQFLPILLSIYILLFYRSRYTAQYNWWLVLVWYGIAKVFELYDHEVFLMLHKTVSGHTLKHIFATLASFQVLYYLTRRAPKIQ